MMKTKGAGANGGADRLFLRLSNTLQWFSRRPLLALIAFVALLLFGSVLLPFLILNYFSLLPSGSAGGGRVATGPLALTSSRGGPDAFKVHLEEALGIEGNKLPARLQQLAQHGAEYAAAAREKGALPQLQTQTTEQQQQQQQPVAGLTDPNAPASAAPASTSKPSGPSNAQPARQAAVIGAFKHAYSAYERTCMGQDE